MTAIEPETAEKAALREARKTSGSRFGSSRDLRIGLAFVAPAMIGFLIFFVYPTIRGFYLSFTKYNVLGTPKWIGVENYQKMVDDKLFWNAWKVTIEYVILNIGFQTVVALGLAVLMHRLTKSSVIRGSILLPYLIAGVVCALLWFWLLDYQIGIVNEILGKIGIGPIAFSEARPGRSPPRPSSTCGASWDTPPC